MLKRHPNTLVALSNLAQKLSAKGDPAGERTGTLQEQTVAGMRRLLGEEHPDTLTAMIDLAATLDAQGDLAEARLAKYEVNKGTCAGRAMVF